MAVARGRPSSAQSCTSVPKASESASTDSCACLQPGSAALASATNAASASSRAGSAQKEKSGCVTGFSFASRMSTAGASSLYAATIALRCVSVRARRL